MGGFCIRDTSDQAGSSKKGFTRDFLRELLEFPAFLFYGLRRIVAFISRVSFHFHFWIRNSAHDQHTEDGSDSSKKDRELKADDDVGGNRDDRQRSRVPWTHCQSDDQDR